MGIGKFILLAFHFSSLFFAAILPYNEAAVAHDICGGVKCRSNGPPVKFPFQLQDKHPEYCGYQGFNLYCDNDKNTVVELSSLKFFVKTINYKLHFIEVYYPEGCLPKHIPNLNISTFSPLNVSSTDRFTLFNCSMAKTKFTAPYYAEIEIDCLSSREYKLHAISSGYPISSLRLELCTKVCDTALVTEEIFRGDNMLRLSWSLPKCEKCESNGETCMVKNGTKDEIDCKPGKSKKGRITAGAVMGCLILLLAIFALYHIYSSKRKNKQNQLRIKNFLEEYRAVKPARYSYADIKRITYDFKEKLGEGGYGIVYKGKLSDEVLVAVKLLHDSTGNGEEFINEVGTIGKIHHVNVVRLIGFCADGFRRALIYEYLPNGSLDKFIFRKGDQHNALGWEKLQDIALGIARGIEYLHQGCEQRILHFDIKPQNNLLDENFNAKISDFGMAKLCEKGKSAVSMTAARGTMGYMAPEVYSSHFGSVSYKSDIYSFGMLLLEMVGQRKNIDNRVENVSQVNFPEWAYRHLVEEDDLGIQVEEVVDGNIARKLAIVGLWCIRWNPVDRPAITFVLQMLEGNGEHLNLPPNPFASTNPTMNKRPLASALEAISESE